MNSKIDAIQVLKTTLSKELEPIVGKTSFVSKKLEAFNYFADSLIELIEQNQELNWDAIRGLNYVKEDVVRDCYQYVREIIEPALELAGD